MNLTIRQADSNDARLISALGIVTFYEAYFEQDTPEDMANYLAETFSIEQMERDIADPDATFYIALLDGKAVGYAKLLRNSTAEGLTGASPIELKRIYLVERIWGRGVGSRLLDHCIEAARQAGHESIWLGVWEANARGLSFYRKHGFVRVGTITFPYGDTVGINHVLEKKI
jgi:GNAT superfamily N-acetyltransferase